MEIQLYTTIEEGEQTYTTERTTEARRLTLRVARAEHKPVVGVVRD